MGKEAHTVNKRDGAENKYELIFFYTSHKFCDSSYTILRKFKIIHVFYSKFSLVHVFFEKSKMIFMLFQTSPKSLLDLILVKYNW